MCRCVCTNFHQCVCEPEIRRCLDRRACVSRCVNAWKNEVCAEGACLCWHMRVHFWCPHQACCWVFLYSILQFWQICCCSAHLIIINIDPPQPTTHIQLHTPARLSFITTFFSLALPTTLHLSFVTTPDALRKTRWCMSLFTFLADKWIAFHNQALQEISNCVEPNL